MLRAYDVAEARRAEEVLLAQVPDGALMQRAARGLADGLYARVEHAVDKRVAMLVGSGNNGGDALYAAVHLADRGVPVALLLTDPEQVHSDALRAALGAGARVVEDLRGHRLVVDAVVGIGGQPGLRGPAVTWRQVLEDERPYVVAVDVPSGVDVDGATVPEPAIRADTTYTFGTYKPCLLAGPAADWAAPESLPVLVDIGLGPHLGDPSLEALEAGDPGLLLTCLQGTLGGAATQKYSRGVVGVAAGSEAYAGAAQLCVRGARAGVAGMVRFVGSPALAQRVVDRCPEVVAHTDPASRGQVQAWVVGPGGGDDARERLEMALEDGVPVVVDADALQHVPDHLDVPALLTPHAGELARMLDVDRAAVEADPLGHVRLAARRWDATVLLKGARTLVARTGAPTRVNLTGSPWLATAGAGDVLAGLAGSFLAAGADPRDAGALAAFVHGAASVVANPGGPVTASAVADAIPGVVAAWRNGSLSEADVRDWRR